MDINVSKPSGTSNNDSYLKSKQRLSLSSQTRKENKKNYKSPVKKQVENVHNNDVDSAVPPNDFNTSPNLLPPRPASTFTINSKTMITNKDYTPLPNPSPKDPPKKSNIESIVKKIAATGGKKHTVTSAHSNPSSLKNKNTGHVIKPNAESIVKKIAATGGKKHTVTSTHSNPSSLKTKNTGHVIRPNVDNKKTTKNLKTALQTSCGNKILSKAIHGVPFTSQIQSVKSPSKSSTNTPTNPNSSMTATAFSAASKTIATSSSGSPQTRIEPVSTDHLKPTPNSDTVVIIDSDDEEEAQPKIPNKGVETPRVILEDIRKTASPSTATLNSSIGSLNSSISASASDKKISKKIKIKMMEKKLELLEKKINKFAEQEVSLFDMDKEESAYIQEAKLKEEFIKNWRKYCKMVGDDPDEYVSVRKKIKVRSAPFPEINREVERYINRNGSFPNVFDIKSVCIQANNKHSLEIKEVDLQNIAVDVFTEVGQKLQKTREKDLRATSGNALTDLALKTPDPALEDQDLKMKLKRNKKIAKKKTEDVFNDYVRQQYEQMRPCGGDNQESSDDGNDDDDANDMETLRRKNLIENKKVKQKLIKDKTGWKEPAAKKPKRVENTTVINVTLSSQEEPVNNKQKKIDCLVTVNASSPKYTSGSPKPQQHSISSTSTSAHKNDSPKLTKKLSKPTTDSPCKPPKKLPQLSAISSVTDSPKQTKNSSQPVAIKPITDSSISAKKISQSGTKPTADSPKQSKKLSQSSANTSESNSPKPIKKLTQSGAKQIPDSPKPIKKLSQPQVMAKNQPTQKPLNNDNKKAIDYEQINKTKSIKSVSQLNELPTSSSDTNLDVPSFSYKSLMNIPPPDVSSPTSSPLSKKNKSVHHPLKPNLLRQFDQQQQLEAGDFPGFGSSKHTAGAVAPDTIKTLPGYVDSYESPLKRFRSIQSSEGLSRNTPGAALPNPSTGTTLTETVGAGGNGKRLTGFKPPVQNDEIVVIDDSDDDE